MSGLIGRRAVLAGGGAALITGLCGRSAAADTLSRGDLAEDVAIVRQALALHPGLNRYARPATVAMRLEAFGAAFGAAGTSEERYLLLSRFLASIRCGHSYANFYNQKKAVAAQLFDRPTRLPFRFAWIDDNMVVTEDPTQQLSPGTRIRSVNGVAPAEMLRALLPYVRADGHNDAKRRSLLEVRGDSGFETFDIFQGLLFPPPGPLHRLDAVDPAGRLRRIELPAIGLAERRAQRRVAEPAPDAPLWQWEERADGVAVLTMPSWSVYASKWDWQGWLDARLDGLAGARGLLVDLRDNEGGRDCGDPILARVIRAPFVPPAVEQRLRFERTPPALDPHLDTWDQSFRTLGVGAKPLPGGFFLRPGGDAAVSITPSAKRLPCPVHVLIGPVNSSATFQFASHVRTLGAGTLYGAPTGGNRRGINGGCFFFVRLPASGLEFDLPLVGYFPTTAQPDAGLLPDVPVSPSVADIAAGRDVVLDRALRGFAKV